MAIQPLNSQSIDKDKIPKIIYGVTLTESQIASASQGESVLLENLDLPNGRVADAKVSFYEEKGEVKMKLLEKKEQLVIPDKIDSYVLTKKDKEDLVAEKPITIKLKNGELLFVQYDKDLNRVTVKTEKDIKVPNEVGGYKLTDQDKALFANKQKLPIRAYYNEKTGTYFLANIRLTDDSKGIEFTNYKEIPKSQVNEMIAKYNSPNRQLENVVGVATRIDVETTEEKSLKTRIEKNDQASLFVEFVKDRNYSGLEELSKAGFKASPSLVEKTTKEFNYTKEEKTLLQTTVKLDTTKQVKTPKENQISI